MPEQTEKYVRVNITRNTKGYSYETTVSIRTTVNGYGIRSRLDHLNDIAQAAARAEIERRRKADDAEGSTT